MTKYTSPTTVAYVCFVEHVFKLKEKPTFAVTLSITATWYGKI